MAELKQRGPVTDIEKLRVELHDKVNALGIGAQGLGRPRHRARRQDRDLADARRLATDRDDPQLRRDAPRARHARWLGAGPSSRRPSSRTGRRSSVSPRRNRSASTSDNLTPEVVASWKPGDPAAAQRQDAHRPATPRTSGSPTCSPAARGCRSASVCRTIYYVGPVDPVAGRSGRPGRPHDGDADGQVHQDDARPGPARDGRQGRTRADRDRRRSRRRNPPI